jgi:hypothetical protein
MAPLPSGASWIDIDETQLDKKSPVDDILMDSVGEDLYYLKNNISSGGGGVFEFKVNGNLGSLRKLLPFRRIDGAFVMNAVTLANQGTFLEIPGTSGTLEIDIRKYRTPQTPIIEIAQQYQGSMTSITRAGAATNTQSITRATAQVATQSISYWKSSISISSIISVGGNLWRYNLSSTPDSDWKVGDYVNFSSCSNANNDGTFAIVRVNEDSGNNIVVTNGVGVAQTSAGGYREPTGLRVYAYCVGVG